MSRTHSLVAAAVVAVVLLAKPVSAQDVATPPEVRVITTSTFVLPYNEDRSKVMAFLTKYMVGPARANPNLLSLRIADHWYGAKAGQVILIREYPNWAAITADCPACDAWNDANVPKEGAPGRAEFEAGQALFLKYYSNHSDEIYSASMNRAKH